MLVVIVYLKIIFSVYDIVNIERIIKDINVMRNKMLVVDLEIDF